MDKKNVYLFQPQYSTEINNENNHWLPYSVGCLWSYAAQFADINQNFVLQDLFFKRDLVDQVLEKINNPVVCGFSCYLWNEQYCHVMAEKIKNQWPDCVIVFGGPQVNIKSLNFTYIDSVILGEGEEPFVRVLRSIVKNQPVDEFFGKTRLQELDIPSPYTTGVFEKIFNENPEAVWSATIETNRGCPYSCTFCDWGSVTYSKVKKFSLDRIAEELEWATTHRVGYIFLADANFGIFKERDLKIAQLLRDAADRSMIDSFNIQYAKNSTDVIFEIAKTIGPYSRGITVSVQSMNDNTLTAIKRENLSINNIARVMSLSAEYGVGTYTEVILGLPNETYDSWVTGMTDLLELGQHQNIDIWFAQLLENSELAQPKVRKQFGIQSILVEDYMTISNSDDRVTEYIEIVNATNTMSTEDLVSAYAYTWMIIHLHINGYTQLISRYARTVKNISYKQFYDALFKKLQQDDVVLPHYKTLVTILQNYLACGKLPEKLYGHAIHSISYEFFYLHRAHITNIAVEVVTSLSDAIDSELTALQNAFLFSTEHQYPIEFTTNYNLFNGEIKKTHYYFESQVAQMPQKLYLLRRKGLLKNTITIT
jgi:radical SAM superfamily enzyme YgiQ (UPF0313 family)